MQDQNEDLLLVMKAADTAARWHVGQRRKGAAQEPYINHLLEVAALVTEATQGRDPNLTAAALLHDAIEDQQVTRETIAEMFGEDVAALVEAVTDDKARPKQERKRLQVENAPGKQTRAKMLKLADKTSNLRAIAVSAPAHWPMERRLEYVAWARNVAARLRGASEALEREFDVSAGAAETACGTVEHKERS